MKVKRNKFAVKGMVRRPIEVYFPMHEISAIAVKESKAKRNYRPVYTMHKWWARRLGSIFRSILLYSLIEEDTKIYDETQADWKKIKGIPDPEDIWNKLYLKDIDFGGKIVLDPFFGGGTTIVEALRMGCKVIGKELNPVAWFITKKEIEPVSLNILEASFQRLQKEIAAEILKYYKTICPRCNNEADGMYHFWVREARCLECNEQVLLFRDYRVAKMRSKEVENQNSIRCESCRIVFHPMEHEACPNCKKEVNYRKYVYVVCPTCGELFGTHEYKKNNQCTFCGTEFNPSKGRTPGQYYLCPKEHKHRLIEAVEKYGKVSERLYAVEYYCEICDKKGYKKPDQFDRELFHMAKEEFLKVKDDLPIPKIKVPMGHNTKQMINHAYFYFRDMFNERQLLNLGKLFLKILEIQDRKVREQFLLIFSNTLDYNNTFCLYNIQANKIEHLFLHHAYIPRVTLVENNIWGIKYGRGTFTKEVQLIFEGNKYCLNPYEKYIEESELKEKFMLQKIEGKLADNFEDLVEKNNVLLLNGSSDSLEIPDDSIDAIITDPPYYDNVMYSELADFFYVWLREGLKQTYPQFEAQVTPNNAEIIKNKYQGKSNEEYTEGLTRVFKECYKKLKDEGLLVFTFHHGDINAWIALLKTILASNFFITAIYPIQAEMSTSLHIQKKANIEYDIIMVCRKRLGRSEKIEWGNLQSQIFQSAEKLIREFESQKDLSPGNKFVIVMGKSLELYSKYWPEIYVKGKRFEIEEAIQGIDDTLRDLFR